MENAQDQDAVISLDIGDDVTAVEMGADRRCELRTLPRHARLRCQQRETIRDGSRIVLGLTDAETIDALDEDGDEVLVRLRRQPRVSD